MLALSTCWNQSRHDDGEAIIDEILELGVRNVELSHGLSVAKLPGFIKAYREEKFNCVGVHNFFPSPVEIFIDSPDAYEFSDRDKKKRDRAIRLTLESLEKAAKFGAKYIVLHLGSVSSMNAKKGSSLLESLIVEEGEFSLPYVKAKSRFVKERYDKGSRFVERSVEALKQFIEPAKKHGIQLAVESRSHYEQVPSEDEMVALMEAFKDEPTVGYWHDFGHVHRKHNLGLLDHERWLSRMSEFLIGGHFHDVVWPHKDHQVPFTGSMNFEPLLEYFTPEMPMVWEINLRKKKEDLAIALEKWHELPYTSRLT